MCAMFMRGRWNDGAAALAAASLLVACLSGSSVDTIGSSGGAGGEGAQAGGSRAGGEAGSGAIGAGGSANPAPDGGSGGGVASGAGGSGSGAGGATGAGGVTGAGGTTGAGGSTRPRDAGSGGTPVTGTFDAATGLEPAGIFVAVGYGGRRTRSIDDGHTWTDDQQLVANGGDDNMLLRTITWGNGQFVALGYRSMTSPDGQTWVDHGVTSLNQWMGSVTYAKSTYVAVGGYGLRATSTDGVAWSNHMLDTTASHEMHRLVYGDVQGGRFVSANDNGQLAYSSDGKTWQFAAGTNPSIDEVAFGNGLFVGVGASATVVSNDGVTWTSGPKLAVTTAGFLFAQAHFTAIGSGHVFTSVDGQTWTDHAVSGIAGGALAYGHGTFVLVQGKSRRRSNDGLVWDPAVSGGTNDLVWVAFGPAM